MANISILKPVSHFDGTQRLLNELITSLSSSYLNHLRIAVAFAKATPIVKLLPHLDTWRKSGKKTQLIVGLSHKGTSMQALEIALTVFDEVFVCYPGSISSFHPKIFLFSGLTKATCFYGSHNLTVGGTETNFEAGIKLDLVLPADAALLKDANDSFESLLPAKCSATKILDRALLKTLIANDLLLDETVSRKSAAQSAKSAKVGGPPIFVTIYPAPQMPIAKSAITALSGKSTGGKAKSPLGEKIKPAAPPLALGNSLAIQIVPHPNGEVFLSKVALDQNPTFFGYPFTGKTTPKKVGNPSYPQRQPDPLVDVTIFGAKGNPVYQKPGFSLNMVLYEKKGEVRITFSSDLLSKILPFSLLHMYAGTGNADYGFDIYNPGSPRYLALIAVCNQTLASGGAAQARKMGWF